MTHKIPCEIIQDLLPLYVDELVSETTKEEISEHLKNCPSCSEGYAHMKKEIKEEAIENQTNANKEIDYLKTLKKKSLKKRLVWCSAVVLLLCGFSFIKMFVWGSPTESYLITYLDVNDDIHIGGAYYGSAEVYSHYKIKETENGSQLVIYSALASPWNRNGVFNLTIPKENIREELHIHGNTVKPDGTVITRFTNEVYKKRHPYVGDASANGALAGALGIAENLGSFKNELQTTDTPYGWTLRFENSVPNSIVFEEKMRNYAIVLIALVDNLEEVHWEYPVELPEKAVIRTSSITLEECNAFVSENAPDGAYSVKDAANSPENLQNLLQTLGISSLSDN